MSKHNTVKKGKLGGFTLIELLVVMSIISMLMAILLPGLSNAREQGKRIVCLSNQRQLTMAWVMYAMDNEDELCSPGTYWNDDCYGLSDFWCRHYPYWVTDGPARSAEPLNYVGGTETAIRDGVLWPYIQTVDLYKCKSERMGILRDYSISAIMGNELQNLPVKENFGTLFQISGPSEEMVFIDAAIHSASKQEKPWLDGAFWPIDTDTIEETSSSGPSTMAGPAFIDPTPPPPPPAPEGPRWNWTYGQSITARHSDGCNLSFADLHCEYWKWKDKRTVDFANEKISGEEASENNQDLERMVKLLKVR